MEEEVIAMTHGTIVCKNSFRYAGVQFSPVHSLPLSLWHGSNSTTAHRLPIWQFVAIRRIRVRPCSSLTEPFSFRTINWLRRDPAEYYVYGATISATPLTRVQHFHYSSLRFPPFNLSNCINASNLDNWKARYHAGPVESRKADSFKISRLNSINFVVPCSLISCNSDE